MASCLGLGGDVGQPAAGVAVLFSRLDAAMLGTGWVLDVVRAAFGGASIAVGGGREGLAFGEATPAFGGATPAVGDGALDVSCNQRGGQTTDAAPEPEEIGAAVLEVEAAVLDVVGAAVLEVGVLIGKAST